jgi:hypothetical protein
MSKWEMGVMELAMGGDDGDGGHEGHNKWPTTLDWIIFPYLDDNGCLKS